jgi:UDP-2,3-diacylglucosamine pyrophosphatase LpxH
MAKREVEIIVLSDIHLGTYGCHATELLQYLKTVKPKKVILNGDIIDMWQFSKRYWPASHMMVVKQIIAYISKEIPVVLIPGNHDEMLRRFRDFNLGSLQIVNKLLLNIDNKRTWVFHGDVFDVVMQNGRWLAQLGAVGYDTLILINRFVNFISEKMGKGKVSLSKNVKNKVKGAVKFINNFEETICDIAIDQKYDCVICGHIHQPEIKEVVRKHGTVTYLNSGDWIENLTALEYNDGKWSIYNYHNDPVAQCVIIDKKKQKKTNAKTLMNNLMVEFKLQEGTAEEDDDFGDM